MQALKKNALGLFALLALLAGIYASNTDKLATAQTFNSNSSNGHLTGFAWSGIDDDITGTLEAGAGWISFNCENDGYGCGANPYGVTVDLANGGALDGYAWSSTLGWLSFVPADTSVCGTPNAYIDTDNLINGDGVIRGWARFLVGGNDSEWNGCVRFDNAPDALTTIDMQSGQVGGSAWGSNLLSWISFDCATCNVYVITDPFTEPQVTIGATPEIVPVNTITETTLGWNEVGLDQPLTACNITVSPQNATVASQLTATTQNMELDQNNDYSGQITITNLDDVYEQGVTSLTFTIENCIDEDNNPVAPDTVTVLLNETAVSAFVDVQTTLQDQDPVAQSASVLINWSVGGVQPSSCTTNTIGNDGQDSTPAWETIFNGNPNQSNDSGTLAVKISCSTTFQMTCQTPGGELVADFDGESVSWCGSAPTPGGSIPSYIEL